MPRLTSEGNVKVYKIPAVSDKQFPTTAEVITAGTNLTPFLPTAGVSIDWTQNNATLPMLDESFTIAAVGTESATIELTGVRNDTSDDFWDAFDRGENFFLGVSRFGVPVAGSVLEIYPVQSHRPVPLTPAGDEFQQARVSLAITDTPELNAVLDGS
jgi:hypothetical protein